MKNKILVLLFLLISCLSFAQEKCLLDQDAIPKLVIDQADVLTNQEEANLTRILEDFQQKTSVEMLVVTVTDLCGYDQASFTYTLGENWGVGNKKFDNGLVMMIKPTGGKGQRKTFIATGYGLEGVIPDATASTIVNYEMIPRFKQQDFYGGISAATDVLMKLALEEYSAADYRKRSDKSSIFPLIFVVLIFIIIMIGRFNRARRHAVGHDMSFWAALWLMSNNGHRRGGGWDNFNSGSGNFGGFGGFGGGSFGGGGAGGSW